LGKNINRVIGRFATVTTNFALNNMLADGTFYSGEESPDSGVSKSIR
jgi:hypothetical protein